MAEVLTPYEIDQLLTAINADDSGSTIENKANALTNELTFKEIVKKP